MKNEPTRFIRFEYDLGYTGGDYGNVGDFEYVPVDLIKDSPEQAFEEYTKISNVHIIHYTMDEVYVCNGDDEDCWELE